MDYRYTRVWKIENKLIIADTIEEAIALYKTWAKDMENIQPTDITTIKAIGDNQTPENYDVLIKAE